MSGVNIAHIRADGTRQSLEEHLRGTAEISRGFAAKVGMSDAGIVMGLLHDLGKATDAFNDYIQMEDSSQLRGTIDHSTAGAQYLQSFRKTGREEALSSLAIEMMQISIASHHSGLINCVSFDGDAVFSRRIKKNDIDTGLTESESRVDGSILSDAGDAVSAAANEIRLHLESIGVSTHSKDARWFQWGLLTRYLLSCLIDADRIDTIAFQEDLAYSPAATDWRMLRQRFEDAIGGYRDDSPVSVIRRRVSDECLEASSRSPGVFTLSVPTGGGKTLSSFRFALNHLIENGMDRIIYVVPYLTIIEQNARVIEGILNREPGNDYVTECHSNVDVREKFALCESDDGDNDAEDTWSSPMDSWDGPVVFTSMVQFLDVLFGSGTRKIRRMHNLANSVIVFDEIQSLPVKTIYMFDEAVDFLCRECGSTAVLCTATQPGLGGLKHHALRFGMDSEIIGDVKSLFESLRRTEVRYMNPTGRDYTASDLADLALESIGKVSSVLAVVNTKWMAEEVYRILKPRIDDDVLLIHLSTNMCPVHRRKKMDLLIRSLGHRRVLCISTQLIEAGVDVDFDTVIRSMAGLDSIVQAAGRCNRNARRAVGEVLLVRTAESIGSLTDISEGRRCAELVMRRGYEDLTSPEAMSEYYEMYFNKRSRDMGYYSETLRDTLFDLLSENRNGLSVLRYEGGVRIGKMSQAFMDANREFKVIDETDGIIVPYDDTARSMIAVLCGDHAFEDRKHAMRVLQRYTVNTFALDRLIKAGTVHELEGCGGSVYCLAEGFYDEETGIREVPEQESLIFRGGEIWRIR